MRRRKNRALLKKLSIIIFLLQLSWGPLGALDPGKPVEGYMVDKWDMSDGLASNEILSIAQTPDGYLWIASSKNLVRFDGINFLPITFIEKEKIKPREAIFPDTLYVDRAGNLWIGSSGGLTLYDYKTGRFRTFTPGDGLPSDRVRRIKEDMRGNLWISFFVSYVGRLSNGKFTGFNAAHGLAGKKINAIIEDQNGNLLFGDRENGVFIFKDGKFSRYPIPGLENSQINIIQEDTKGNLWIGTTNGLFKISSQVTAAYTTAQGLSANHITDIFEDSERNIWVGAMNGLNRIKIGDDGTLRVDSLLPTAFVLCFFEDREKNLWIGTNNEGLKRLKDGKFTTYAPLDAYPGEIFPSLFEDGEGDLWIGTFKGRIFHCRGGSVIEIHQPKEMEGAAIVSGAQDSEGNLWIGTIGKGVFQKKKRTYIPYTTREGLSDNTVISIYRDSKDDLWFSTLDGVTIYRNRDRVFESFTTREGLSGKLVGTVMEVPHDASLARRGMKIFATKALRHQGTKNLPATGRLPFVSLCLRVLVAMFMAEENRDIWIGADRGITVLTGGRTGKENIRYYLEGEFVTCIYKDTVAPGVYWVATDGAGLKRLTIQEGKLISVISYTTAAGMVTDRIYQFQEDRSGNFWMMSDTGVLRLDKNELNLWAGKELDKINCISYGPSEGLKDIEFDNIYSRNSIYKARNGELWFITKKGISVINPEKMRINKVPPPVSIEAVTFNGSTEPFPEETQVYILKGIKDIEVFFTAPTFLSPAKVQFKYRLEGYDKDWVFRPPGKERRVHYHNLGPGRYTFRVIASNAEGVWNPTGDSFAFTLKPFYYQTLAFKIVLLLFLVVLGAAVFFLYRIYKKRVLERREQEKEKEKYKGTSLNPQFAEVCIQRLGHLVEKEKIYCDPGITLQTLAERLSIQPYQLSQVLNEKLRQGFSDFINSKRIEEAKKRLASSTGGGEKNTTVAYEVGFNSMTAFYKAFKKYTGKTPNRYKKGIKM